MTLEEAMNELALFGTGLYGKPLPKQNGAPIPSGHSRGSTG